jgi:hypothetical protein
MVERYAKTEKCKFRNGFLPQELLNLPFLRQVQGMIPMKQLQFSVQVEIQKPKSRGIGNEKGGAD